MLSLSSNRRFHAQAAPVRNRAQIISWAQLKSPCRDTNSNPCSLPEFRGSKIVVGD